MLQFDGATKWIGPFAALDGCTFEARPGRLTGSLGPNGAGKTTAMRAVFGLVELDGVVPPGARPDSVRPKGELLAAKAPAGAVVVGAVPAQRDRRP